MKSIHPSLLSLIFFQNTHFASEIFNSASDAIRNRFNNDIEQLNNGKILRFKWKEVLFEQDYILSIWRYCNRMKLNPIADTFLGKIKAIRIFPKADS